jgi:hypothetical protein
MFIKDGIIYRYVSHAEPVGILASNPHFHPMHFAPPPSHPIYSSAMPMPVPLSFADAAQDARKRVRENSLQHLAEAARSLEAAEGLPHFEYLKVFPPPASF